MAPPNMAASYGGGCGVALGGGGVGVAGNAPRSIAGVAGGKSASGLVFKFLIDFHTELPSGGDEDDCHSPLSPP